MKYSEYIQTTIWRRKSKKWIDETEECEKCGKPNKNTITGHFTCHHKSYENIGNETREDITVLCWWCHQCIHKKWVGLHPRHNRNRAAWMAKQEKASEIVKKDIRWLEISKTLGFNNGM